ncbi:MAG: SWF/SNF helicase family protein, partial [Campylobacterales bacterium]|nr:SWF/SNF helicase family protein [Campylobacterales bacterium]
MERSVFESYSKAKKLLSLLNEIKAKQEKVIIFVINHIGQDMLRYGIEESFEINVDIINGSDNDQNSVKRKLDAFTKQNGFGVIILSPLAAGVGLTITEANHVVHYERWWNASKEDQASDRVYRIGQNKDVFIHYIIGKLPSGKKSIDEAIHELIAQKRETAGFLIPPKS